MTALELLLRKAASDGDLDFLKEGVAVLAQLVMDAEVSTQIGAARGERAPERRLSQRNGYRERGWDTRVGSIELQIPKLRDGSFVPSLLEPRGRAERARCCRWSRRPTSAASAPAASRSWSAPSVWPTCPRARSAASAPGWTPRTTPSAAGRLDAAGYPHVSLERSTTRCASLAGW